MAVLIKGGRVYAPEDLGVQDILLVGDKIVNVAKALEAGSIAGWLPDTDVVDARGQVVVPGFIDPHVHLLGGGGEMGFATRTPEAVLSEIIAAGVTTVAGLLGTDGATRSVEALYAKAKGLEQEGITTFIYTGSYKTPSVTITGSVARDIMFVDSVIGVKMALSDHRSSHFTFDELTRLASDARVAGMLSGKPGVVHIHMGAGKGKLDMVMRAVRETDIPISQFVPTHVTRTAELFTQARQFARMGGRIDITSFAELNPQGHIKPSKALMECLREEVPAGNITVSSDGYGSVPKYDHAGNTVGIAVGRLDASLLVLRNLLREEGLAPSTALQFFTANAARVLGAYPAKGCIRKGSDADVVIMDKDLKITTVFARGRKMLAAGKVIVKGTFEA